MNDLRGKLLAIFGILATCAFATATPRSGRGIHIQIDNAEQRIPSSHRFRVHQEFNETLSFDDVVTWGKIIWPDGYKNLNWTRNFRIYNEREYANIAKTSSPFNALSVWPSSDAHIPWGNEYPEISILPSSPAESFDLYSFTIAPIAIRPNEFMPQIFTVNIRAFPAGKGDIILDRCTLPMVPNEDPITIDVTGVNAVEKIEIWMEYSESGVQSRFALDDIAIGWKNPRLYSYGYVRE